jgi:hypothetical protein
MPKVSKNVLIFISGLLWSGVGLFLIRLAFRWIEKLSQPELLLAIIGGLILGSVIAYFGFSGLANKNIERINMYQNRVCIWAFQKWSSYVLIAFMMSLGIFMRNAAFIPKLVLIPMYIGIGLALFLASFRYYIFLFLKKERQDVAS